MGINPTPTNHRSFTFDGKSTREFGVYTTGKDVFNSPERAVEMISIPGRDGEYALDQGHFNNIEVTYRAGIVADSTTDFAEAISNFRNWLASRKGYCRLTDEYNTEEYRMAVFKNAIALEHEGLLTGEFDVTFDCKPQRYLAIGEELVEIGAWGNTETAEGEIVTIDASSDTAVKALTADIDPIQDLNGYDAPWVGGAGKNKLDTSRMSTATASGVTFSRASDGTITVGGKATATVYRTIGSIKTESGVQYTITGTPSGGASGKYRMCVVGYGYEYGSGHTFTGDGNSHDISVDVYTGYPSSGTLTFKPMIRLASETDATYEPYENICPISGHDAVDVYDDSIYGGLIEWNQYINNGNFESSSGWSRYNSSYVSATIADNKCVITALQAFTGNDNSMFRRVDVGSLVVKGNKYLVTMEIPNITSVNALTPRFEGARRASVVNLSHDGDLYYNIYEASGNDAEFKLMMGGSKVAGDTWTYKNVQLYDLTKMFGAGNEPTTLEEFKSLFPLDYYAYNSGTTTCVSAVSNLPYRHYTTQLGQTVYGGTLDVVSGVLTVTHGYVDMGTLTWNYNAQWGGYPAFYCSVAPTGIKVPLTTSTLIGAMCSQYTEVTRDYLYGNNVTAFCIPPDGKVSVRDSRYTSASGFKTAMNGVQLCYELATPQTYQLTPQQIELLLGENNIFADSGNVTVEVGQNPSFVVNPTLFDSKPLLAVEGYGEIKFNNRSIVNIENATLGDIKQLVNESKAFSMTTTFDNAMFNVGDTITVDLSYFNYGAYIIMNASTTPTTSGTVTDSDAHFTTVVTDCVADQGISPSPLYVHVKTTCTPITFTLGTPDTVTNTTEAVVDTQGDKCKWTQTVKYEIDGSGNHKISIKQTLVGASGTNVTTATNMNSNPMILCNSVVAHSTLSILGNPTYIDCDIGEAYMIKDGQPISLNQYIDLGSDLPTLPSGDTEVTYDNTITKVEVKPNWWKV